MKTIEEIRERLKPMNLQEVAKATRLHPNTIYRLVRGEGQPLYTVVKRVSDYLESL